MVLDARHGLLGDGRIRLDGRRTRVQRDTGGWYVVRDSSSWGDARVLYRELQDLIVIQWAGSVLRLAFHAGEGEFTWEDRAYRIGTMIRGQIRIQQGERVVATGHVTVSGVHLESIATELLPIICPIAWAFVLRSEALARDTRVAPP